MTQSMNASDCQPTQNAATATPTTHRYGTEAVDFSTKYTSNIKDAYKNDEPWAKAIIDAEKAPIARANYLNTRGLGKRNLYGVLQGGLRVTTRFNTPDPTVTQTLQQWARYLNADFPPTKSYTPEQLMQRVANLDAVVGVLNEGLGELAQGGEISKDDMQTWRRIIEGLESYAEAADHLLEMVSSGPNIDVVYLDVDARRH